MAWLWGGNEREREQQEIARQRSRDWWPMELGRILQLLEKWRRYLAPTILEPAAIAKTLLEAHRTVVMTEADLYEGFGPPDVVSGELETRLQRTVAECRQALKMWKREAYDRPDGGRAHEGDRILGLVIGQLMLLRTELERLPGRRSPHA